MSESASKGLYDAAVNFLVSEKTGADAWAKVAEFVATHRTESRVTDENAEREWLRNLKLEFTIVERQVKKDFDVPRLPGAWRSAKSTAINGALHGLALLDDEGKAKPKTDVSKLIKGLKAGVIKSPLQDWEKKFDAMTAAYAFLNASDKATAATRIGAWFHTPPSAARLAKKVLALSTSS